LQEIFGKIATETQELVQGEAMDVYGDIYYRPEQMEKRKAQIALADPPTVTTDAIDHALFDKYPRTRYIVANFSKVRGHGQGGRRHLFNISILGPIGRASQEAGQETDCDPSVLHFSVCSCRRGC
jgi:hypothetical protein